MAKTLGFTKLQSVHGGIGPKLVYGTVASIVNGGSFSITLDSAGSKVMRNIQTVTLTPIGTAIGGGSAIAHGFGSSNGYIHVNVSQVGSTADGLVSRMEGTLDLNFMAIGGAGSI